MIVKELPHATCTVLRFQIGEMEMRNEVWPRLGLANEVLGLQESQHKISVFHLYGFGSTLEMAEKRVKERFPNYGKTASSTSPESETPADITINPAIPADRIIPLPGSETN
jgi:hypothetical protein